MNNKYLGGLIGCLFSFVLLVGLSANETLTAGLNNHSELSLSFFTDTQRSGGDDDDSSSDEYCDDGSGYDDSSSDGSSDDDSSSDGSSDCVQQCTTQARISITPRLTVFERPNTQAIFQINLAPVPPETIPQICEYQVNYQTETLSATPDFDSATSNADFAMSSGDLVFSQGITTATVTIEIIDDEFVERNEIFGVSLTTNNNNLTIINNSTVVIIDEDVSDL